MPAIFPSRSDYETLIRRLDVFAADSAVKTGRVLMRKDGLFPQAFSGGRAVVFPVLIEDRKYAIKCWIQSLGALEERYKAISRLIQGSKPPYLIESVYREKELLFNGARYPVLQMQWSESRTLKEWISDHINDSARLSTLAQHFLEVVADMHRISMSHGDLQHENILVSEDSMLTLVDYDSIYLNGLDHLDDEIKGLPGFQHQSRSRQAKANPKSDFISEYVIYITLVALSKKPNLWNQAKDHNRLLFSQDDLSSPSTSVLFQELRTIDGLSDLIDAFQTQCLYSELNDITAIESIVSLPQSPTPSRIKRKTTNINSDTTTKRASGSARDLRKADIWAGSQESSSDWIFGGLNEKNQSKTPSTSENNAASVKRANSQSTPNKSREKVSSASTSSHTSQKSKFDNSIADAVKSSTEKYQSLPTPNHSLQGSLRGLYIKKMDLKCVSIEDHWIRLVCIDIGGLENDFLVFNDSLIGLRSLGSKLELVTSNSYGGTDVLTILAPDSLGHDNIYKLLQNLKPSLNDISPSLGTPVDNLSSGSAVNDSANTVGQSNASGASASQGGDSELKPAPSRTFAYSTIDDIAFCTGIQHHLVQSVVNNLRVNPPFTLVEADRIAGLLLGDYSIRRAYDKRCSGANPDVTRYGVNEDVVLATSGPNSKQETKQGGASEWQKFQSGARFSERRKFSYSSVDDIAFCTGKDHDQVLSAAKKIKAKPPFSLIEADRIAGLLLGDPSIRRAFMKTTSSKRSSLQDSSGQAFGNDSQSGQSFSKPLHGIKKEPVRSPGTQGLTDSSSQASAVLVDNVSKRDCFVATAIYVTEHHPELTILRNYRDRVLLSTIFGRGFVSLYYKVGPAIAQVIIRTKLSSRLRPIMSFIVHHLPSGK